MKKIMVIIMLMLIPLTVWAQDLPVSDFASEVLNAIKSFGGLPWVGKIAAIVTLLIASMKVSVLNQWFWSKLGSLQAWVAPILGALLGVLTLASGGNLTLAGVLAYFSAGAGALILHELLDSLKALPSIGGIWLQIIDVIESQLGGPGNNVVNFKAEQAKRLACCKKVS